MPKRLVCAVFAVSLAVSTPVFAQGRNDDSDVRVLRGGTSPLTRIINVVKRTIQDLYEITIPHP